MTIRFIPLSTDAVRALQAGGADAYGNAPERRTSDGDGVPCRHCLKQVPAGRPYLVVAFRPFTTLQAYAETGPIFLCADKCQAADTTHYLPEILKSPDYIVRGYNDREQIVYGTGAVTPREQIAERAGSLLADGAISFVHVRSARNNCFQCRIERG
jgi:hypothetical protein